MKKIKQLLLFAIVLILLVGVVSASEVSKDKTGTNSITKKAVKQDTHKVSYAANKIQEKKADENIITKKSINKTDKNSITTKKSVKSSKVKVVTVNNWEELKSAANSATGKEITLKLKKGTYKNNGLLIWVNVNTKLTIDGNGQTIDGNKRLAFSIRKGSSLVLRNITIKNCEARYGGAIVNHGKLTIIQSTFTKNNAGFISGTGAIFNNGVLDIKHSNFTENLGFIGGAIKNNITGTMTITQSIFTNNRGIGNIGGGLGGAIENSGTMTITKSTLSNNTAQLGGAIYNSRSLTITDSTLANNTAEQGGAIKQQMDRYISGDINFARNTFINNRATRNKETIDLSGGNGHADSNVYKSTDISFYRLNLSVKDNQSIFHTSEDVILNFNINIEHPNYYDQDIFKRLEDITIYINDVKNVTNKNKTYTLSKLKPGNYTVYYKTSNQKSNNVTFMVASISNWQELQEAVNDAKNQTEDTTLFLMKGNYTNTGTIKWINPDITLTIDGNGQTIDGNQLQVFNINGRSSMLLKNITIVNAKSTIGGAINNEGRLTVIQSTFRNNTGEYGGAIENLGKLTIKQSTLSSNTAELGGAINNYGPFTITESVLADNTASDFGGAIRNYQTLIHVVKSNFTGNKAGNNGGAIFSYGNTNLTDNIFTRNTAKFNDTIDLDNRNGTAKNNVYESTDIRLKPLELSIKDDQTRFTPFDEVVLNFTISLRYPRHYDSDILERLEDIKIYVNGVEYDTTNYKNYTLTNLKPGDYTVYFTTCNQKSKNVTFKIIEINDINLTTWDVEMVQGRSVTFSALVDYKNSIINLGQVYFEIDGKALLDEKGVILYAPVEYNKADLPYDMPNDISLGEHTLTAVYLYDDNILAKDEKTLTIIENIPEGAGEKEETPSEEERYTKDTAPAGTITNFIKTVQSSGIKAHKVTVDNNVITVTNAISLGKLNEIFGQTFINGHLLVYIDGELVFNGTIGDKLTTFLFEIMEKYLVKHEIKVEFTDADGKTNTYNKSITIE